LIIIKLLYGQLGELLASILILMHRYWGCVVYLCCVQKYWFDISSGWICRRRSEHSEIQAGSQRVTAAVHVVTRPTAT